MIRIAAVGDVHFDRNSRGRLSRYWPELEGKACAFLIAGDLTQVGHPDEIKALADDLRECPVPVIAVLGNHDYHLDREDEVKEILEAAKVRVLDHSGTILKSQDTSIGIYGLKGFGGGFMGACCSDFGEPEMKAFVGHTKQMADDLREGLLALQTDYKIALLHYSPTAQTLLGEKKEIYPFLGSYLLAEAIDDGGANVAFHGHAHKGTEHGVTLGGVPVRNVAQHVIRHAFKIYSLDEFDEELSRPASADLKTPPATSPG
ncbi:MAG: metallophosphoesterase [Pseudobdellovibrionaceae bacterium]